MVCISCIVIPFMLWFFQKYIRPIAIKFLPEKWAKYLKGKETDQQSKDQQSKESCNGVEKHENGSVKTGGEVTAGGGDKKND